MVFFALHPSGILWNRGFEPILQMHQNKKPSLWLRVWCFWLSVVHLSGLILNAFALMPLRASSLCSSSKMHAHLIELGVRTYSPVDANKKPQLEGWGLIFGAPGGIRTPDQVVRSHLLYPAELRVLEVL